MNGIITLHNPTDSCPNGSKKLGSKYALLVDNKVNKNIGEFMSDYKDTGFGWRRFSFCEHPIVNAHDKVPKNSYFAVTNKTCPVGSTDIGEIAVLDSMNINEEDYKRNAFVTVGGAFLRYRWLLPRMCKANIDIPIKDNIILPARNCTAKSWHSNGGFGVLQPIAETNAFNNPFEINIRDQVIADHYIIQPKMCVGGGHETIIKCTNPNKFGIYTQKDAMKCDKDMKELCKTVEYGSDPICSCINSPLRTLSNPSCIDKICMAEGYMPQGLKNTPCNISNVPIDCDRYAHIKKNYSDIFLDNNRWTEYCFESERKITPTIDIGTIYKRSGLEHYFTDARIYVYIIGSILLFMTIILYIIYKKY